MARSASKRRKYCVFISHASADKWLATVICEKLGAIGIQTFRDDRDIDGGDDIPDAIRAAIERADEMVVLLTPASVYRPWVLLEVGAAWQKGCMRIVAILQHIEVEPIPDMLKSKKVIDLNKFEEYVAEVAKRSRLVK